VAMGNRGSVQLQAPAHIQKVLQSRRMNTVLLYALKVAQKSLSSCSSGVQLTLSEKQFAVDINT
jgi:hypothetical protein